MAGFAFTDLSICRYSGPLHFCAAADRADSLAVAVGIQYKCRCYSCIFQRQSAAAADQLGLAFRCQCQCAGICTCACAVGGRNNAIFQSACKLNRCAASPVAVHGQLGSRCHIDGRAGQLGCAVQSHSALGSFHNCVGGSAFNDRAIVQIQLSYGNAQISDRLIGSSRLNGGIVYIDAAGAVNYQSSSSISIRTAVGSTCAGNGAAAHNVDGTAAANNRNTAGGGQILTVHVDTQNGILFDGGRKLGGNVCSVACQIVVTGHACTHAGTGFHRGPLYFLAAADRADSLAVAVGIDHQIGFIIGREVSQGIVYHRDDIVFASSLEVILISLGIFIFFCEDAVCLNHNGSAGFHLTQNDLQTLGQLHAGTGNYRLAGNTDRGIAQDLHAGGDLTACQVECASIALGLVSAHDMDLAALNGAAVNVEFCVNQISLAHIDTVGICAAGNGSAIVHADPAAVGGNRYNRLFGICGGVCTADQVDRAAGDTGVDTNGSSQDIGAFIGKAAANGTVTQDVQRTASALNNSLVCCSNIMTVQVQAGTSAGGSADKGLCAGIAQVRCQVIVLVAHYKRSIGSYLDPFYLLIADCAVCVLGACIKDQVAVVYTVVVRKLLVVDQCLTLDLNGIFGRYRLKVSCVLLDLVAVLGEYAIGIDHNGCALLQFAQFQFYTGNDLYAGAGDHRCTGQGGHASAVQMHTTINGATSDGDNTLGRHSNIGAYRCIATLDRTAVHGKGSL